MSNAINDLPDPSLVSDEQLVRLSGRFDTAWYLSTNADIAAAGVDPVTHYVNHGAKEGREPAPWFSTARYRQIKGNDLPPRINPFAHFLRFGEDDDLFDRGLLTAFDTATIRTGLDRMSKLPLFDAEEYLGLHPNLRDTTVDPARHALTYGFAEGRNVFRKTTVAKVLGRVSRSPFLNTPYSVPTTAPTIEIDVVYNSLGNSFIREIAEEIVLCLKAAGILTALHTEKTGSADGSRHNVIVAPHEFFHLGEGKLWATGAVVSRSVFFNTEQPQTLWFERGMPFMLMGKGVVDISPQVGAIIASSGVPTLFFNPTLQQDPEPLSEADRKHPLFRVLPPAAKTTPSATTSFEDRPIAISFFGGQTDRRDAFFARNSAYLAGLDCFLYYRKFSGPILDDDERDAVLPRLASHVCGHSKITLNVHRDEYGFFEWHRIVRQGMAMGSLVVTEPCLPHPVFLPGEHYFEETGRHMPDLIDWLLKTPDGQFAAETVRKKARAAATNTKIFNDTNRQLAAFVIRTFGGDDEHQQAVGRRRGRGRNVPKEERSPRRPDLGMRDKL